VERFTKHHLKKRKKGLNGTIIASAGYPETYGLSGTLNYKSKTSIFYYSRYNDRVILVYFTNSRYLNADNSTRDYVNETEKTKEIIGYNGTFGIELYRMKKLHGPIQ
jgi:hypothetical protein